MTSPSTVSSSRLSRPAIKPLVHLNSQWHTSKDYNDHIKGNSYIVFHAFFQGYCWVGMNSDSCVTWPPPSPHSTVISGYTAWRKRGSNYKYRVIMWTYTHNCFWQSMHWVVEREAVLWLGYKPCFILSHTHPPHWRWCLAGRKYTVCHCEHMHNSIVQGLATLIRDN